MRDTGERPTCKVLARRKGYVLYENGELWATGSSPYLAGCLMMPVEEHLDCAIEEHEEEMRSLEAQEWFEQSWWIGSEY